MPPEYVRPHVAPAYYQILESRPPKIGHASEQDRPDVLNQRHDWSGGRSISNRRP